jgi:hypothetical protein
MKKKINFRQINSDKPLVSASCYVLEKLFFNHLQYNLNIPTAIYFKTTKCFGHIDHHQVAYNLQINHTWEMDPILSKESVNNTAIH